MNTSYRSRTYCQIFTEQEYPCKFYKRRIIEEIPVSFPDITPIREHLLWYENRMFIVMNQINLSDFLQLRIAISQEIVKMVPIWWHY